MKHDLLSHRVETLHLRVDAPFPSEAQSARDMIKEWRRECRLRLVPVLHRRDSDADVGDLVLGEDE